jgi:hypothetical protein
MEAVLGTQFTGFTGTQVQILTQQVLLGALQDLRDPDKLRTAANPLAAASAPADEVLHEEDEESEVTLSIKVVRTSATLPARRMLTYADVCCRMMTDADGC